MTLVVSSRAQVMRPNDVGGVFLASYQQRATEVITYEVDYSRWLGSGETLTSVALSVTPLGTTPDLTISAPELQGGSKRALFQISDGQTGSRYKVQISASTSTAQVKIDVFYVRIGSHTGSASFPSPLIPDPLPNPTAGTLGGVRADSAPSHQWMTGISLAGAPLFAQPDAADLTGLGDAALLDVGTGAGTVAAGNDSRITGAAQKSANLSDLASAATARTNLGAGSANGLATLDGDGKVPTSQLPSAVVGALAYQGTWNANTNSPTIPSAASGNKGYYYKVATAGSTNVDGITDWKVGDWIVSNGATWDKIDNTDQVTSVAGKQGVITLVAADMSDATTAGKTLLTAADAAAQRTALGLGNSATKAVGSTAGTVAAGDDSRIVGAVQKSGDTMTGSLTLTGVTSYIINGSGYFNAGATGGSTGYGIRDNGGVMEVKNSGGFWTQIKEWWVALTSSNALTNSTAAQPIFDGGGAPANGAITLPIGTYFFEAMIDLGGLYSAGTKNIAFGFGGTATIGSIKYVWQVSDASSFDYASATAVATAAATNTLSNNIATLTYRLKGIVRITGAGTFIPQITQVTNSAAANVLINSYFKIKARDTNGITAYQGPWS